jgi:hypothetical protein
MLWQVRWPQHPSESLVRNFLRKKCAQFFATNGRLIIDKFWCSGWTDVWMFILGSTHLNSNRIRFMQNRSGFLSMQNLHVISFLIDLLYVDEMVSGKFASTAGIEPMIFCS